MPPKKKALTQKKDSGVGEWNRDSRLKKSQDNTLMIE